MEVSGQLHAPAALTPGKQPPPRTHWIGGWGGPQSQSGHGVETYIATRDGQTTKQSEQ